MAQQLITEGISGEEAANIINENDTELFEAVALNTAKVGGTNATTLIKGGMAWVVGLTYQSLGLIYEINGTTFIIADGTEITYDAADGTNPRLDLIYGDDTGALGKSTGTPGAIPSANTLESNQIQLTISLIEALATEPTGQSIITVFTEGVGQPTEYDATENTGGARIDMANAVDPISGSVDIKTIANLITGDDITLIHNDTVLIDDFQYIKLSILSLRDWKNDYITVFLFDGSELAASIIVNKNIIDVADLVTVQELTLFKAAFNIFGVQFDRVIIKNISKDKILYQLDDIYIGLDTTGGGATPTGVAASDVSTDTSNFDNNLSSADDSVQEALKTINDLVIGGGGGGANYYTQNSWIDSSNPANFMGILRTWFGTEYDQNVSVAWATESITTITPASLRPIRPFFVVSDNQTIEKLKIWAGWQEPDNFLKIALIAVIWTESNVFESVTELCDVDVTIDSQGYFSIDVGAFTETQLNDGDVIYVLMGSDTVNEIAPVTINLKTNND